MVETAVGVENTQFNAIYPRWVARLAETHVGRPRKRWRIWLNQNQGQQHACFDTDSRDICDDRECRLRDDCVRLRAGWRR